jgi:hypothetical protein
MSDVRVEAGGLMRLSNLRLFRVSRATRIVLTIAPLLLGSLLAFALWIPPALRGINEDYVPRGDPYIVSQIAFFSGVCLSVTLGIGFIITRKFATDLPRTKLSDRTKWLPICVLVALAWLALLVVELSGQGSRIINVVQTLIFLGIVLTSVRYVREIRRRRNFDHEGQSSPTR